MPVSMSPISSVPLFTGRTKSKNTISPALQKDLDFLKDLWLTTKENGSKTVFGEELEQLRKIYYKAAKNPEQYGSMAYPRTWFVSGATEQLNSPSFSVFVSSTDEFLHRGIGRILAENGMIEPAEQKYLEGHDKHLIEN